MSSDAVLATPKSTIVYVRSGRRYYPAESIYNPELQHCERHYRKDLPIFGAEEHAAWLELKSANVAEHRAAHGRALLALAAAGPDESEAAHKRERLAAAMLAIAERLEAQVRAKSRVEAARAEEASARIAAREARRVLAEAEMRRRQLEQADAQAAAQAERASRWEVWPEIKAWHDFLGYTTSARTVEAYSSSLESFIVANPGVAAADVTQDDLVRFLAERRRKGYSSSTLAGFVTAFRSFFGFVRKADSPAAAVTYPEVKHKKQRALTAQQVAALAASFDRSTIKGVRDFAILSLMVGTGLRASELCRLELSKVDFGSRRLSVICKGGEEQEGAFTEDTAAHLQSWLELRPRLAAKESLTLFVSMKGGRPLNRCGLNVMFRAWAKVAGLDALSPHDLRRTFAVLSLKAGAPTRVVQVAGRWSNVAMVELYSDFHIQPEDLNPYSPVANLKAAAQVQPGG